MKITNVYSLCLEFFNSFAQRFTEHRLEESVNYFDSLKNGKAIIPLKL